ncbi:MAG: LysR substrate-binding domain-containing protein [Pseudomonadota bacterium]
MDLRQLRSLVTLADNDFNVSRTAENLNLVQPAISQHLKGMEAELEAELFIRHGKRLVGLTEIGERVIHYARRTLAEVKSIQEVAREHADQTRGVLRIGTTHTQARYVLPPVVKAFASAYPGVELEIHQGTPQQLVVMAIHEIVDLSICTEALGEHPELIAIPCYKWNRCLITQQKNPLLRQRDLSLKELCDHPIITYVFGFTGRGHFSETFTKAGLRPKVVLSAADTDVIKTYVSQGMGVGIIASLAYTPVEDIDLEIRDLSNLFPWEITKIAYRKGKYLRRYQERFIKLFRTQVRMQRHLCGFLPI